MGIVVAIGLGLFALGIVGLVWGFLQKLKAGRVTDAPFVKTGDAAARGTAAANPKGAISVEGNVECPQPIYSPVTNTPCLFYELKVTCAWKDGETHKTKELTKEKAAAQFSVNDGSGSVRVDARSGGDLEPEQIKEETKGAGLLGGITGQDLMFGNYRVSPGVLSMGTKYTVREAVLPVVPRLYVCGKAGSSNEITSPSWRQLLLSNKSRDDLLAHASQSAKMFLIGGGAAFVVGLAMSIVGGVVGGGDDKSDKTAATATAGTAAPPGTGASTNAPAGTGAHPAGPGAAPHPSTKPAAPPPKKK